MNRHNPQQADEGYVSNWNRAINGDPANGGVRRSVSAYPQPQAGAATIPMVGAPGVPTGVPGGAPYGVPQAPAKKPRGHVRRRPAGWYVFLSWTALLLWAAFIFYMSSHTSSDMAQGIYAIVKEYIEKIVYHFYGYVEDPVSPIGHFCEYLILGALLGNALHCHMPLIPATIIAVVVASGYGVTDEVHQIYVDGRYCDVEDWKIDTAAAAIGSLVASVFFYLSPRRRIE
jgi:VanZ family protein